MCLGGFDVLWFDVILALWFDVILALWSDVILAKAGIQMLSIRSPLDSSVRGNDGVIRPWRIGSFVAGSVTAHA
jgi:hypothetical protein